ncbi:hypothetical protein K449DRAFT_405308 [Hypoxylon sp. EC38]|nr:hypothetical protein K449DRAFT_405308 [Hypoxylon sp. EC38]
MESRRQLSSCDGLRVIHVALFRMATRSLAEAYRILGYKTHHGLDDVFGMPWDLLEKAAEASWPATPGARPRGPFTRADWDEIWGSHYDVATDMASPFADQLIKAYPDAKSELLDTLFSPASQVIVFLLEHIMGIRSGPTMLKVHFGFFGAKSRAEIEANAKTAYNEYYERIKGMVPPERRLEYKMDDGWEPLCAFLGKEVPDVPFPRLNDRKTHKAGDSKRKATILLATLRKTGPMMLSIVALGIALWYSWGRH